MKLDLREIQLPVTEHPQVKQATDPINTANSTITTATKQATLVLDIKDIFDMKRWMDGGADGGAWSYHTQALLAIITWDGGHGHEDQLGPNDCAVAERQCNWRRKSSKLRCGTPTSPYHNAPPNSPPVCGGSSPGRTGSKTKIDNAEQRPGTPEHASTSPSTTSGTTEDGRQREKGTHSTSHSPTHGSNKVRGTLTWISI